MTKWCSFLLIVTVALGYIAMIVGVYRLIWGY